MKKKTKRATQFIRGLHTHVAGDKQVRQNVAKHSERLIQTELRPVVLSYLTSYFRKVGYKDAGGRAHNALYWEGQEQRLSMERTPVFGSRNYPDFSILSPYSVAIEYKQSKSGSEVKHGIGQSIMHTLSGDFDFVYFLFHDENKDKRVENAAKQPAERAIMERMWQDFNVLVRFV